MYLSPQKISFKKGMRGYRPRQVDAYIETLCNEFVAAEEDYQSRIVALEKEIDHLQKELDAYRTMESENKALRDEMAQLRRRRLRFVRRSNSTPESKAIKMQKDRERTERFFNTSAELIRIVGNTGRQVSRLVSALPAPSAAPQKKKAAAPDNVKDAKQLLKALNKQEKAVRKSERQTQKADKILRRVEKKQKKLLKKA